MKNYVRGISLSTEEFVYGVDVGDDCIYNGDIFETIKKNTLAIYTGKDDINEDKIFSGDKFTFDYLEELDKTVTLIGSFDYNDDEMRWEIEVHDDDDDSYRSLYYVANGIMSNFKLMENR